MHFYSGHHRRYKRRVVIRLFLREYRICSPEFLEEEVKHVFSRLTELNNPRGFLIECIAKMVFLPD